MSTPLIACDLITPQRLAAFRATLSGLLTELDGLPLGLHWLLAPAAAATASLTADGHAPRSHAVSMEAYPRRMWVGGRLELLSAIPVGAPVRRITTLLDVDHRIGGSGPLCLTGARHVYESEPGAVLMHERQDLAFRGAPAGDAPAEPPVQTVTSDFNDSNGATVRVEATPVLLFRYSALTFNAHRIHYDLSYAHDVERYPALVVQGPLQATVLLNLAARLLGRMPDWFDYRAIAPLFAGGLFEARGWLANGGAELSVRSSQGQTTMTARAA